MSDATQDVSKVANEAISSAIAAITINGGKPGTDGLTAQQNTITQSSTPTYPELPAYALEYAPVLWLHEDEKFWPGDPFEHLRATVPHQKGGQLIELAADLLGKPEMLDNDSVKHDEVFLVLNEDPREHDAIECLVSIKGKPNPGTGHSDSTCWIIKVDKTKEVGPGYVDIFYFFFYPYNLGNVVAGACFGNHVGDWEHIMVRFLNGEPQAIHLSAHADGHSYPWSLVEKEGKRPVAYVAAGSHAHYGRAKKHYYSPVGIIGPADKTSKGVRWDPTLNYLAVSYSTETCGFSNMTACPTRAASYRWDISPQHILSVLNFPGRWGNSFSELREYSAPWYSPHKKRSSHTIPEKLRMLKWAEAPTGPRSKSLERVGMTWNSTELAHELE